MHHPSVQRAPFREDIERLRGLAVAAVVLYHFDVPGIFGGYVGVDIFFVVSGFLITQIMLREIRDGSFSFTTFYVRRIRRLLPALYVMVALTFIPAAYMLLPSEQNGFAKSVSATVTFSSNVLFWLQAGYFDRTAVEKPLLHTWSLAVEEQFYLVFPLLLWAVMRWCRRWLLPVLWLVTLASFGAGLLLMKRGDIASAFYLSPFRAWEFGIGSILSAGGLPTLRTPLQRSIVLGVAYVLLIVPINALRPTSAFPGWNALPSCLGAMLFIWSGTGTSGAGERHPLSPYRIFAFLGKISYSLYLWHWPVYVFARFSTDGLTLSANEKCLWIAVTIAISTVSWRYVEQPFRDRQRFKGRSALPAAAAASIALVIASLYQLAAPTIADRRIAEIDAYNSFDETIYRAGTCFRMTDVPLGEDCLKPAVDRPNVLVWGDSHTAHYYPGLARLGESAGFHILQATQPGCTATFNPPSSASDFCRHQSEIVTAWLEKNRPDAVIMSGDWMSDIHSSRFDRMIADIKATADALREKGIRVVVIGPAVQFKTGLPSLIMRALAKGLDPLPVADMLRGDIFTGDAKMRAALPDVAGFTYLSAVNAICPERRCPALVDDAPLTWDYGHLTVEGSAFAIKRLFAGKEALLSAAE